MLDDPSRGLSTLPTHFAHYRIESLIGRGGMGEVYRAFDTRLDRTVAIKVMAHGAAAGESTATRRFLREARAASGLNHPNIVIVHEIGETEGGDHFIVQEFVEGPTLRALLDGSQPVEKVCDIGGQIASALAAAHQAGIAHRDIKPENVILRSDGYVKVLDFGLAHLAEREGGESEGAPNFETDPGSLLGTATYMSPEQASGDGARAPTDVWSLGVVLYEMLAGSAPFEGPTPISTIAAILTAHPPPLEGSRPDAPRGLVDVVHAMLAKDPALRPTARDVVSLLSGVLDRHGSAGSRPGAAPRLRTMVGRDKDRARLLAAYERASDGTSGIVALSGEPGIGKTRLMEDFLDTVRAAPDHPTIATGRCSETLAGSEAYLPILEALEQLRKPMAGPSFEAVMRSVAPTWYAQVALEQADGVEAAASAEAAPAASQERMKRELRALLEQVSRLQPLVLVVDDLHWADVSTIDMINYLAGHFSDMRVLILTCYRPSDMALAEHPFLAIRNDLQARGVFVEVELDFLSRPDVDRYLELEFPGHALPSSFADAVHRRTEGSPLFMADLVRYLRDSGGIVEEDSTWRLASGDEADAADLPESVRGMIARKIEQVDEAQRRLLRAASVQGHEFDSTTLADALDLDPAEVEDRLDELERVHVFVRQTDEHETADRTLTLRYQFVHVLYQNVLFASLRPTRRAQLAGQIANALAAHHAQDASMAARLGVLYETAREFEKSARYFFIAAQRAVALFGYSEALALAERGLEGLTALADGPARHQLELGLQMVRGHALRAVKGWAALELERTFARARELCQLLNDPPELFPVQWNLTFYYMIRGDLAIVSEQTALLMEQAESSGNPAFLMAVHHVAGVSCEFLGELVESNRLLERARDLHVPGQHEAYTAMFGIDPGMIARAMSSRPLWSLGYPDRALARSHETIGLGRSQRQPVTLVFALIVAQGIHLYRGEVDAAMTLGDEIVALCSEYGFPQEAEWAKAFQGSALALQGRVDEGAAQLEASLAALEELRSGLVRPTFLALLGDAHLRAGRIERGLAAVGEGFAHAERTMEGGFVAELHRVRGELQMHGGEREAAESSLRDALAKARSQQARSFELRAATTLAQVLLEDGRPDDARAELRPVYDWFTEGHETADLQAARSLLSRIG